jgi:hypothetical protein
MSLSAAPGVEAVGSSFEPNDSIAGAAGPLAVDQTYSAEISGAADRDYFSFYVAAAHPVDVSLALSNLGGGSTTSAVNAAIVDPVGTPLDAFAYAIGNGAETSTTQTLKPGKYFVEVAPVVGSEGEIAYTLRTGGEQGAFAPYAQIASSCAEARSRAETAKRRLSRARTKLQRTTARLRGARYASEGARQAAARVVRRAKARVAIASAELRAAVESERPWCFIAD